MSVITLTVSACFVVINRAVCQSFLLLHAWRNRSHHHTMQHDWLQQYNIMLIMLQETASFWDIYILFYCRAFSSYMCIWLKYCLCLQIVTCWWGTWSLQTVRGVQVRVANLRVIVSMLSSRRGIVILHLGKNRVAVIVSRHKVAAAVHQLDSICTSILCRIRHIQVSCWFGVDAEVVVVWRSANDVITHIGCSTLGLVTAIGDHLYM